MIAAAGGWRYTASLRRFLSSGSFRGALTFGLGGIGFAVGNIMLAAALPPVQFGLVSLVMALMQFGLSCGPLGLDVVVKRHNPRVTPALFWRAMVTSMLVAGSIAISSKLFYGFSYTAAALLFAGGTLASSNSIIFSIYQGRGDQGWALGLAQGPNYVLLILACIAVWLPLHDAMPILAGVVGGYLIANLLGWSRAGFGQKGYAELDSRVALREGAASVSIGLALQLLWQLERVTIPKLASVEDLATYAVLAAVVGAPFRVTQIGVAFTLIESLRSAPDARAARAVLKRELLVALLLVTAAIAGVLVLAPLVFHYILDHKYPITPGLIAATVAVGVVRVIEGFSTTAVTALGTERSLFRISALGWISLGVAIVAAIFGSRFGLVGIVLGSLVGWLTLSLGGTALAVRSFRHRFA